MTPSIFIARILGPVLLIVGLGLLFEGETFRAMAGEFLHNQGLIYLAGILTLAAGLAVLNVHHLWTRDWRVLITILGWLFVFGGIVRILAMPAMQRFGDSIIAHQSWPIAGAIVTLALGGFLTAMGYQDVWDRVERPRHRSSAARSSTRSSARSSASVPRSVKRPRRKAGHGR